METASSALRRHLWMARTPPNGIASVGGLCYAVTPFSDRTMAAPVNFVINRSNYSSLPLWCISCPPLLLLLLLLLRYLPDKTRHLVGWTSASMGGLSLQPTAQVYLCSATPVQTNSSSMDGCMYVRVHACMNDIHVCIYVCMYCMSV